MTNQQYLSTISAEEWVRKIDWLYHEYGKRFTCSEPAIIEWLKGEYKESLIDKRMTNGEVIKALFPNETDFETDFDAEWWNALYKADSEDKK